MGVAMSRFEEEAADAMAHAEAEVRRTIDWLRGSQLPHWRAEITRRREETARARNELNRAQAFETDLAPKSHVDLRRRLELARSAEREAEDRLAATKRWARELEHQLALYTGRVQPLATLVASRLPQARARLGQLAGRLEAYVELETPAAAEERSRRSGRGDRTTCAPSGTAPSVQWQERVPDRRTRDRAPLGVFEVDVHVSVLVPAAAAAAPRSSAAAPPARLDRVIVAPSWRTAARLVLHRMPRPSLGDSGWYLGDADATAPPERPVAVRCAEVVEALPELEALLELPEGTAIVIADGWIERVDGHTGGAT